MIEDKTRESAKLDYKRAAALGKQDRLKIEISKDVSSFANAGGGTIIYGIAEDEAHEAERVDGVDPKESRKSGLMTSSLLEFSAGSMELRFTSLT